MILIHELTKKYKSNIKGEDIVALDNVDLFLPDKGFVAIYGASGCGKSTLLNILGGLDYADSGSMIVNGRNTSGYKEHDWNSYRNQEIGFIFQNYYLLPHLNVFENVAISLQMSNQTKELKEKVDFALKQVGLSQYSKRYPRQLSGGQQQRVAIARALVTSPSIILADEPTGALDEKSSISVMENLKSISENFLVVMVTHNEKMAREYADRMIEISYGKIIEDKIIRPETDDIICEDKLLKVHLPLKESLKWSVKNVIKKKSRTIPIAVASAIGLASAGIVISMTNGVNKYVDQTQRAAIKDYPVYVTCYSKSSSESRKDELIEFPEIDEVIIDKPNYGARTHYLSMQKEFMDYASKMPRDYYAHSQSNVVYNFNLLSNPSEDTYTKISTTSYTMCIANDDSTYKFINEQYDVLAGHLPQTDKDLCLVVDTYNRVDVDLLTSMGFDTSTERIKFSSFLNSKEYKMVSNNDFYKQYSEEVEEEVEGIKETVTRHYYKKVGSSSYKSLYESQGEDNTLKVTGIIRAKHDSTTTLYNTLLLYHPSLLTKIQNMNEQSDIVKDQKEYGLKYDVINRAPFQEVVQSGYVYKPTYLYESRLVDIGGKERVTSIYFYTDTFEQRIKIMNYINKYELPKDSDIIIRSRDYLEQVTSSFSSMVDTFSSIVFVFSLVSIFVAAILTAILTYIAVLERKREIGLLRSLGARKIDISFMFMIEAIIIGIISGGLGIALCYIVAPLAAQGVVNLVDMAGSSLITPSVSTFSSIQPWIIPAMIVAAIFVGLISSLIPAVIAGRKKPAESLRE